jgi:hypothetical protein
MIFYPIFCKNLQDALSVPRILIASSGRACRSAIWTLGEPRGFFLGWLFFLSVHCPVLELGLAHTSTNLKCSFYWGPFNFRNQIGAAASGPRTASFLTASTATSRASRAGGGAPAVIGSEIPWRPTRSMRTQWRWDKAGRVKRDGGGNGDPFNIYTNYTIFFWTIKCSN